MDNNDRYIIKLEKHSLFNNYDYWVVLFREPKGGTRMIGNKINVLEDKDKISIYWREFYNLKRNIDKYG